MMIEAVVFSLIAVLLFAAGGGMVVFGAWMYHRFVKPDIPGLEDIEDIITETISRKFEEIDEQIIEAMDEGDESDG